MRASHALLLEGETPLFFRPGVFVWPQLWWTVDSLKNLLACELRNSSTRENPPPFFCGPKKSIQFFDPPAGILRIGTPLLTFINAILVHQVEIFTVPTCFYLAASESGVF